MKKKFCFFALAISTGLIISAAGFNYNKNQVAQGLENAAAVPVKALALDESEYASHYLARYYNQDGFDVAKTETRNMVVPGGFDNTSKVEWKVSYGRYSNSNKHIRLGGYFSEDVSIATNGMVTGSTDEDFAAIDNDLGEAIGTYNVGMISTKYFTNIQDISIYWSDLSEGQYRNRIYIIYKTDDSNQWKILLRDDGEGGVGYDNYSQNISGGTGVNGDWNAYAAHAGDYTGNAGPSETGDFAINLKGKNAKIGFIYSVNRPHWSWYLDVTAICINRTEAIKGYINFLDRFGWACTAISESGNLYNMVFDVMGYKFLQNHADALDVEANLSNGKEATYYNQFAYLYNVAKNTQLPYSPASAIGTFFYDNKFEIFAVSLSIISILGLAALIIIKKRKATN